MPKLFISYRRDDTRDIISRIYDLFANAYGQDNVFVDVDRMPVGDDFREVLKRELKTCDVVLVVIGPKWLTIQGEEGNRRLDNPSDFVRMEVEHGLNRKSIKVIPVLVKGATMPNEGSLPPTIKDLAYRHAANIRDEPHFDRDVRRLIQTVAHEISHPLRRMSSKMMLGGGILLIAVLVFLIVLNSRGEDSGRQGVALQEPIATTQLTSTSTITLPTATSTLDRTATHRAELTQEGEAIAFAFTQTAEFRANFSRAQTATATLWTATLTPTVTLTTTDTPTPTQIPTNTPIPTATNTLPPTLTNTVAMTPTQTAILNTNLSWIPQIREFNGVEMVLVPEGCFMMGSPDRQQDERPPHEQCFNGFWIDRYEVTNAQYGSFGVFINDNQPRDSLTWYEARNYCETRGGRLPTEAEWEYTARGPENWVYPWGNTFVPAYTTYFENANMQPSTVGARPDGASWVGAYDMSGNVWEWTSSIYRDYPYENNEVTENTTNNTSFRVLRGGSWRYDESRVRGGYRGGIAPDRVFDDVGVRCVRDQ